MVSSSLLTEKDYIRYRRQILFPSFGEEGQKQIRQAHVLIAGVGGLGSPVAFYLACSGVGCLTLVDSDPVELSNLNRQILHWEKNIGEKKVFSAVSKLKEINSTVKVVPLAIKLTAENFTGLLQGVDLILDCLDNMETRFILNQGCFEKGVPFVHGGVVGLKGEITTIIPGETPCLECMFTREVEEKKPFPIFGATAALIASLQVIEAVKLLSGFGKLLTGRMLYVNGKDMEFMFVNIEKKPGCRICDGGNQ